MTVSREYFEARGLFVKIWNPGEAIPSGGDGLGPLFNETSCVACHHLGGTGGAGDNDRNVKILSAFVGPAREEKGDRVFLGELEELHPGFRNRTSVVLHEHATTPDGEARLAKIRGYSTVQTRDELVALGTSERSTPALFGAGLVGEIPDSALSEAEARKFPAFPEVKGRVSRLKDGRIGRFGWKGQTATLRDFVLAACSNELGLEVPGHHQATLDPPKSFQPSALKPDMDEEQCDSLVKFVDNLPRPVFLPASDLVFVKTGRQVFGAIGCATCHVPVLGTIDGLYSDLLLHDLGDRFRDSGGGYGSSAGRGRVVDRAAKTAGAATTGEAGPTEWRTPPLWGVADSGPYLHDGRAGTLDEAIRLHGGEAAETAKRYSRLARDDRQALLALLHSLRSPGQALRKSDALGRRIAGIGPSAPVPRTRSLSIPGATSCGTCCFF